MAWASPVVAWLLLAELRLFAAAESAAMKAFKSAYDAHKKGDILTAEKLYREVLKLDPLATPDTYNNLALLFANDGRRREAQSAWRRGMRLFPEDPMLLKNRHIVFQEPPNEQVERNATAMAASAASSAAEVHRERLDAFAMMEAFRRAFFLERGLPYLPTAGRLAPWAAPVLATPHAIERDIEQLRYLLAEGMLAKEVADFVANSTLLAEYETVLRMAREWCERSGEETLRMEPQPGLALFFGVFGRALHVGVGAEVPGGVLSPRVDFAEVERAFLAKEHRVSAIDGVLSPEGFEALRSLALSSTVWSVSMAKVGYSPAYLKSGFAAPVLAQLEVELRRAFPTLLRGLELHNLWAYMYDGSLGGINVHADSCQVQINFWLTPDSALEADMAEEETDAGLCGLVVYDASPPEEWDFNDYNSMRANGKRISAELEAVGFRNASVAYKANRAVLFDSSYFHKTGALNGRFKKGYVNRRINLTVLFGTRQRLKRRGANLPSRRAGGAARCEGAPDAESCSAARA